MSLLSGESFFHTAAYNGPFCHSVMWYNLRNENWQGKAGCYCRKNVVDWCGCSPMVFREKMMHRLLKVPEKFFVRAVDVLYIYIFSPACYTFFYKVVILAAAKKTTFRADMHAHVQCRWYSLCAWFPLRLFSSPFNILVLAIQP